MRTRLGRLALLTMIVLVPACAESGPDTAVDSATMRHVRRVDEALARGDVSTAVRAWHDAYGAALASRAWEPMLAVGDAHLRIGGAGGIGGAAYARARENYLVALFRARARRSLDGVLRATEAFARLGDRDVVDMGLRVARDVAARGGDPEAVERVRRFAQELSEGRR